MLIDARNKKRLLIFAIVPVLVVVPFFTEDLVLKIISGILLIVYVGFIIFLRDSVHRESFESDNEPAPYKPADPGSEPTYETDSGEEIKIISGSSKLEVITEESYKTSGQQMRRNIFKPPDLKESYVKIAKEEIPSDISQDEQFSFVLEKLLNVIKEAFLAHTAIFFWYNKQKKQLTLEKFASSSKDITQQKYDIENDILSKIVLREEPELLTDIQSNAEKDVIRYYNAQQGIKSFIGVPLYYSNNLAGVLALDSKAGDAFGIETIYSLGRFVRVISIIISLFEEKFIESQSEQRLKAILNTLSVDRKFENEEEIYVALENTVRNLINWDAMSFVYYDFKSRKFNTVKILNKTSLKYIGEGLEVELADTLVGKAIMTGIPIKIDDTSSSAFKRFSKSEDISFEGSFVSIPLVYDEQIFGAVCFESLKKNFYSNTDIQFLKNSLRIFAYIVYSFSNQRMIKDLLAVDIETRTLNRNSFEERIAGEIIKGMELNVPGAVALIHIDKFLEQESLFEGDPFNRVVESITKLIKEELTPLSIIGRMSERIFAVYFFNTANKDVYLWSEKLRVKIARNPISVGLKQTTFTISVGIASVANKDDVGEIIRDAELALEKALEKGGNAVKSTN